jgi:hypothetical protein
VIWLAGYESIYITRGHPYIIPLPDRAAQDQIYVSLSLLPLLLGTAGLKYHCLSEHSIEKAAQDQMYSYFLLQLLPLQSGRIAKRKEETFMICTFFSPFFK